MTLTRAWRSVIAGFVALLMFCVFAALGTWQVERRAWKLDLMARVESRVHAPAVRVPPSGEWHRINAATAEYRHVRAEGRFLDALATCVQALTELGSGCWLLTPLLTADGSTILINRGFVLTAPEAGSRGASNEPHRPTTVTGLLRVTEPGGSLLRRNDAATNRWYSRDVQAIAKARGLHDVAPYFIDADATSDPGVGPGAPTGGLTVIAFHNNHAIYAITWYTLALMIPVACFFAVRAERREPAASR